MKIDGNLPTTPRVDGVSADRTRSGRSEGTPADGLHDDRVDVSTLGELVGRTLGAVADAPAVREDKVARAQQKLAAGEVGQDAHRLADHIIDHLLGQ